jgi:serine/threonine protein kinase
VRAVKIIEKEDKSKFERELFIRETNCLKELSHPNIIEIFEMFED